jgi:hypothetical protein
MNERIFVNDHNLGCNDSRNDRLADGLERTPNLKTIFRFDCARFNEVDHQNFKHKQHHSSRNC